jgi:hypothetical protein
MPTSSRSSLALITVLAATVCAAATACGSSTAAKKGAGGAGAGSFTTASSSSGSTSGGGSSSAAGLNGAGGGFFFDGGLDGPSGPFSDFPSAPIVDMSAPANAATLFAGSDAGTGGASSSGPCLYEPEPDTLYPNNWVRPRFSWTPASNENLFELRLHTSAETHDLLVYTANPTWTMPKTIWTALAADAPGVPITVTIRGAQLSGSTLAGPPTVGSSETITVAPVGAAGTIVYWTTSGGSALKGFAAGDESVALALQPSQVQMQSAGGAVTCIGCHTSTPDGLYAGFTAQGPWGNALASVQGSNTGAAPTFLGAGAAMTFQSSSPLGIQTYSKAHWSAGDHVMVAPFHDSPGNDLAWFDLEATASGQGTSYGFLTRTGDSNDVGAPTWSHDGNTVVYVSTNAELTGRLDNGIADLYAVPYNGRMGGAATPIPGASDPTLEEYYPSFSPDDAFLAFDRIPQNTQMYNQPLAEVFVIPSAGGTATRLAANDPAACTGKTSPGVTNSWPKWAPEASTGPSGETYYWVIFSSTRDPMGNPQLYISGVVVKNGVIETHGALYIWNQPSTENNHTPAWDNFMIPPIPPPPPQ